MLGPEHPSPLISLNNLAAIYSDEGKYKEAEELQLNVLDLHKKVLGPNMVNLRVIYQKQEKNKEAG